MADLPNWQGSSKAKGLQNLYNVDEPVPGIGITRGNEVQLPTTYPTLSVLNSFGIQGQLLTADSTTLYLNSLPVGGGDISRWAEYRAVADVKGDLDPNPITPAPLRDIKDFKHVEVANVFANIVAGVAGSGTIVADVELEAPFHIGTDATFGDSDDHDGSLQVYGGTTLDGGTVHGCTIGSLPVGGVNTVRVDVLPIGIDIVAPTYVTIDAGGAANIAAGGAVSISGGDYVEINTDDIICRNSTAGNDVTRISVGKIVRANNGYLPLRLTDDEAGNYQRGVELTHGKLVESKLFLTNQTEVGLVFDYETLYSPSELVNRLGKIYRPKMLCRNVDPSKENIDGWNSAKTYLRWAIVKDENGYYRCKNISSPGYAPHADTLAWESVSSTISKSRDVWHYDQPTDNGSYSFAPIATDTTYLSIAKPLAQPGVCIVRRLVSDKSVVAVGQVYDSVFNPPTTSGIAVNSDLDMHGYRLYNASKVETLQTVIPEVPLKPNWSSSYFYDTGQIVKVSTSTYRALIAHCVVDPAGTDIPTWAAGNKLEGQIVRSLVSSTWRTYQTNAAITGSAASSPPQSVPLWWNYLPDVNSVADIWQTVPPDQFSLTFAPEDPGTETTYMTLQKDRLDGTVSITRRSTATGLPVTQGLLYDDTVNIPELSNTTCTDNVYLNQHSLLDVDSLDANYIRLGVPDSPYYQTIRWYNEDLCFQAPSSAYIPVSSSWWKTGQGGPLQFELDIREGLRIRDPDEVGQQWTVNSSNDNKLVINQRAFLSTPNSTSFTLENINSILLNGTTVSVNSGTLLVGGQNVLNSWSSFPAITDINCSTRSILNAGTVAATQWRTPDISTGLGTWNVRMSNGALSVRNSSSSTGPWVPVASSWASYAAVGPVDMNTNNISNAGIVAAQQLQVSDATNSTQWLMRFYNSQLSYKDAATPAAPWTLVGGSSGASEWSLYPATENVDFGQNNVANANAGYFNEIRLSIPDTTDYMLYRHYNGEFRYYDVGSSSYLPVAGRWSQFGPLAPVNWGFQTNQWIEFRSITDPTTEPSYVLSTEPDMTPTGGAKSTLHVNAQPVLFKDPSNDGFDYLGANKTQYRNASVGGTMDVRADSDVLLVDIVNDEGTLVTTKQVAYTSDIVASGIQSGRAYIDSGGYADVTLDAEFPDTLYNVTASYFGTGSYLTPLSVANLTTTGFRVYGTTGENVMWMAVRT